MGELNIETYGTPNALVPYKQLDNPKLKVKYMKKTGGLILGVLILFVRITSTSTERMDEVKLKNRPLVTTLAASGACSPYSIYLPTFSTLWTNIQ